MYFSLSLSVAVCLCVSLSFSLPVLCADVLMRRRVGELMSLSFLPSSRFLGHLYAAEALISMDRISDAITHLNPDNVTDVSLGVSPSEQDLG